MCCLKSSIILILIIRQFTLSIYVYNFNLSWAFTGHYDCVCANIVYCLLILTAKHDFTGVLTFAILDVMYLRYQRVFKSGSVFLIKKKPTRVFWMTPPSLWAFYYAAIN